MHIPTKVKAVPAWLCPVCSKVYKHESGAMSPRCCGLQVRLTTIKVEAKVEEPVECPS
jgi:hypothetical protein